MINKKNEKSPENILFFFFQLFHQFGRKKRILSLASVSVYCVCVCGLWPAWQMINIACLAIIFYLIHAITLSRFVHAAWKNTRKKITLWTFNWMYECVGHRWISVDCVWIWIIWISNFLPECILAAPSFGAIFSQSLPLRYLMIWIITFVHTVKHKITE